MIGKKNNDFVTPNETMYLGKYHQWILKPLG